MRGRVLKVKYEDKKKGEVKTISGIVLQVTSSADLRILPYDDILEHPAGVLIPNECIRGREFETPEFSEKVERLLERAYEAYLEMERVQGEIEVLKTNIRHKEERLHEYQESMNNAARLVQKCRFEMEGTPGVIATQLAIDIEEDDMDDLHWTGISMKGMKVKNIREQEGTIKLDIQFRKDWCRDILPDMYWSGEYYDCVNWELFQEKHCPRLDEFVNEVLPFATVEAVGMTCDERLSKFLRNLETFTTYTIALTITSDTYNEVYKRLVSGLYKLRGHYFPSNL